MEIDHLVVGAASLDEGVAWCERVLGVTPLPGGKHALMGTHNRLLNISGPGYERCYLEIIAIDPEAPGPQGRARWFDLDKPELQQALRDKGPGLIHWVARVANLDAALADWQSEGIDVGEAVEASRDALRWRIALRQDGLRLARDSLPVPIEWGDAHPTDTMPDSGVRLLAFDARDGLHVRLATPRGEVALERIA